MTTEYHDANGKLQRIDPGTRPRGATPPPAPASTPATDATDAAPAAKKEK